MIKKMTKVYQLITFSFLVSVLVMSCENSNSKKNSSANIDKSTNYLTLRGETQGTFYMIKYQEADETNYQKEINALLHEFDMSLSTYKPKSLISKINQGANNIETDKYFQDMFHCAETVFEKTDGKFDITVAPLVNAWGFGFVKISQPPDSAQIDSLLHFVGMNKVKLNQNIISKEVEGLMLDGNALAQGQSVDVICDFLASKKITNYLVEIGGEVRGNGKNAKGEFWRIGVDKPIENAIPGEDLKAIISLHNTALATSGNYRKIKKDKSGEKYSHSINPKTGYPEKQNILSATIIAPTCMLADAYATACMISGLEKSIQIIENDSTLGGYFVYTGESGKMEVYKTENVKKFIKE